MAATEIEVTCAYCGLVADLDDMRPVDRGGWACKDIPACDAREAASAPQEDE